MAQKRASPLDEPPTASSSDSEEDNELSSQEVQPSSEHHQHHQHEDDDEEEEASSEEQDDDDDDDDEEEDDEPAKPSSTLQLQPASKKPPPPTTKSQPRPSYSDSDSATDTDSGSDSDNDPPVPNPKVKPLASKPMEDTLKPGPQSSATPARSGSKRPSENNGHVHDPKRAKKKATDAAASDDDEIPVTEEDGKKSVDDSKKQFQRLWSEEDEVAILKGMVEFSSKTGGDPLKDANAFHDFIKKSLHNDASCNQLKQKIRRLKKKFENNAGKGKNGEGPSFSKPHDQKSFELSKKIWANGVLEKATSNGKARKSQKEGSGNVASPKPKPIAEVVSLDSKELGKMEIDEKPDSYLYLDEMVRFARGLGLSEQAEGLFRRGLKLIPASKRAEFDERWKKLQVAELEMSVRRAELIENQARSILDAYKKSSNH